MSLRVAGRPGSLPTAPVPASCAPAAACRGFLAALPAQSARVQSPLAPPYPFQLPVAAALTEASRGEPRIAALGTAASGEPVRHDAPLAVYVGRGFTDAESADALVGVAGDDAMTTDQAPRRGDAQ